MFKQQRTLCIYAVSIFLFLVTAGSVWAEAGYEALFQSMKARQSQLENYLTGPTACLGERLDGLLEINYNCSDEVKQLAEAENLDRQALHKLMAADMWISAEEVGKQRGQRNQDRYIPRVLREIRLSPTETTWWEGLPPDPRKADISRILTLRYASIHKQPDAASAVVRDNVQQYEAFGVVDKAEGAGDIWYKVTEEYVPKVKPSNWSPNVLGWIAAKDAIPWRQALVMRFTNAYQRDPSFFFGEPAPLLKLIRQDPKQRESQLRNIRSQFESGKNRHNGPIAMEPSIGLGQERIIMYPVLDFYSRESGEMLRIDGRFTRLLEVAARTRAGEQGRGGPNTIPIDILFVMDTTHSMKPYLKKVLTAVQEFTGMSDDSELRFGFIGYQDKHPDFDYSVREFTRNTQPARDFVRTLGGVAARSASVKGDDIPECVFEGLNAAMESSQWRERAVKIVFLVGDAPGREDDFNVSSIRDKAFTRNISIFAFHIQNSKVSGRHDKQSKTQYRKLSSTFEGSYGTSRETDHFLPVDASSVDFGKIISDRFQEAQKSFKMISNAAQSGGTELPAAAAGSLSELIFQQAMLLMPDNSVPDAEIRGWVCDKVLNNPGREALAPMLLLTEAELDELEQRVRELKDIGESALRGEGGTTLDFFDIVSLNTRFTMVDPTAVNFRDTFAVPLGIDKLPYESDIMATTREEFHNPDRVQSFVRAMNNKLRHYEDLRRQRGDKNIWKKLSMGASEEDRVVGVELNQLP
ncbi:MAG: DUF1318 domain-containing protein [Desulfobacteraceae bacterium]|nr:DUF1318 domain-containing protein [Desulfobacteraceae bacterium]